MGEWNNNLRRVTVSSFRIDKYEVSNKTLLVFLWRIYDICNMNDAGLNINLDSNILSLELIFMPSEWQLNILSAF